VSGEAERLREIIDGREVPPTDDELLAHHAARGSWRFLTDSFAVGSGDRQPIYNARIVIASLAANPRPSRWWALDAVGAPCAWPAVGA
jgi:hypothetical protein